MNVGLIAANISIDVIRPNLNKKNGIEYQYYSVIHFVLFIASMTFTIFYIMYSCAGDLFLKWHRLPGSHCKGVQVRELFFNVCLLLTGKCSTSAAQLCLLNCV